MVEGLVFALAPDRLKEIAAMLERIGTDHMRQIGLAVMALGVVMIWMARSFAG